MKNNNQTKEEIERAKHMIIGASVLAATMRKEFMADKGITEDALIKSAALLCTVLEEHSDAFAKGGLLDEAVSVAVDKLLEQKKKATA